MPQHHTSAPALSTLTVRLPTEAMKKLQRAADRRDLALSTLLERLADFVTDTLELPEGGKTS